MKSKKRLVRVTANDIKTGVKDDPSRCMLAKAVRRAGLKRAQVCGTAKYDLFIVEVGEVELKPPRAAYRRLRRWEAGQPVKPFEFHI